MSAGNSWNWMGKNRGRKGKYGDSVGNAGNYGAGCEIPRLAQQDGQTSEILAPLDVTTS